MEKWIVCYQENHPEGWSKRMYSCDDIDSTLDFVSKFRRGKKELHHIISIDYEGRTHFYKAAFDKSLVLVPHHPK